MLPLEERLNEYLAKNSLTLQCKIAKGYSSETYRVRNARGNEFALKIEKEKSPRKEMAEREAANLKIANSAGVGPKLLDCGKENRIILMELIGGTTFDRFLFAEPCPMPRVLQKFLQELFAQASALDNIGLDHGQLGGRGRNILVREGKPVIIDFEKASTQRKAHNVTQLTGFLILNKHSAIARRVRETLSGSE